MQASARRGIQYPNTDRSDRPDVPAHILNLINALDVDVIFRQGIDSDRAAAAHQNGGGRFWWSTDIASLWYDDGVNWTQLASAAQLLPSGVPLPYAGSAAPTGYLLCDGSAVSRTTYANLFAVIGTTYGAGNGTSTFNVPNIGGRVPVGKGAGTFAVLGATGGEETHVTTVAEMPPHNHTAVAISAGTPAGTLATTSLVTDGESTTHFHGYTKPVMSTIIFNVGSADSMTLCTSTVAANTGVEGNGHTHTIAAHGHTFTGTPMGTHNHTINNTGGGAAHNNLQPYIVLNYIIKT